MAIRAIRPPATAPPTAATDTPDLPAPAVVSEGLGVELALEDVEGVTSPDPPVLVGNEPNLLLLSAATAAKGRISVSLE